MKKVLILGAGMVVKPIVHYLLDTDYRVTLASRTKEKAEEIVKGYIYGKAISWTVDQMSILEKLIQDHDLTVSLLPYKYHVTVAKLCIELKKDMVTTSYVSPEMEQLHNKAKKAGILILNEIGVDPGYDHMTAMQIIDRIHEQDGKIDEFYSLCGALCAPEASNNPFRYKFSWSPKGVIMASNNDAKFLKDGNIVHIDTANLFKDPMEIDFPEIERMQAYPNRDSLPYVDIYGIPEAKTVYRGTLRYQNWCMTLDLMKALGLTNYEELDLKSKTYAQVTAALNGFDTTNLKERIKERFNIDDQHQGFKALEWLGVFEEKVIPLEKGSPFDFVSDLMIQKMMMEKTERDMVIMQHIFKITNKNGQKETLISRMIDYGDTTYSAIARTVALPAAIAVKLILNKEIKEKGVHIPIKKSMYVPILSELEKLGIEMTVTDR